MMEEEAELDLEEPDSSQVGATNLSLVAVSQDPGDANSSDLTADMSSTSVVGEMTGQLEDEDLMDMPVLLTSSSRTTPLHSGGKEGEPNKNRKDMFSLNEPPIPGQRPNKLDGFSMDNIDLSESHSSYSDLGYSLNTDGESHDRGVVTNNVNKGNEIINRPSKSNLGISSELFKESSSGVKEKESPSSISAYFQNLAVDDPFSSAVTDQTSNDLAISKNPQPKNSPSVSKSVVESPTGVTHSQEQSGITPFGSSAQEHPAAVKGFNNESAIPQPFTSKAVPFPNNEQNSTSAFSPVPNATNTFTLASQGSTTYDPKSQQFLTQNASSPAKDSPTEVQGQIFYAPAQSTPVAADHEVIGSKTSSGSGGGSLLSRNIEQSSNQGPMLYTPHLPAQYAETPMMPADNLGYQGAEQTVTLQNFDNQGGFDNQIAFDNQGHQQYSQAYQQQYMMQQQFQDEIAPRGPYIPLFVPSVYNYSSRPMNQPQIFTPARQDFSSHMTYSSSPSKNQSGPKGSLEYGDQHEEGQDGLWSWVKQTVNADWAEGAQKIGKQLIEKTKHATDTVLTTLDPGMEEYLNPVINIAVGSKQADVLQGIRQGFRNIFGHSVVKGEDVQHGQAPLPVGFPSGTTAVYEKLNELEKVSFPFQGSFIQVALEVFLTELEQQRWNAMLCVGVRDTENGIDLRTFSQPIPLPPQCVAIAFQKSSEEELRSGYGISIDEAVRLTRANTDQDWCFTLCGIPLQSIVTVASQCLAADYKRHLEQGLGTNQSVQLQW